MWRLGLAIVLTLLSGSLAMAQDKAPVVARAEQCLRENVDRVVSVESDVQSAASFLVGFRCAPQVSAAARYEVNVAVVKQWMSMADSAPMSAIPLRPTTPQERFMATVDPETGDIVNPPVPAGAAPDPVARMLRQLRSSSSMSDLSAQTVPTSLRKLAADLVLQARERQLGSVR